MEHVAVGLFLRGGGSSHIAVDYFRLRTFRWNPVSGQLGEDRAMLKPGNSPAEDELHITLDKAIFIIMASYGPGLEFSGTLESAGLSLLYRQRGFEDRNLTA